MISIGVPWCYFHGKNPFSASLALLYIQEHEEPAIHNGGTVQFCVKERSR